MAGNDPTGPMFNPYKPPEARDSPAIRGRSDRSIGSAPSTGFAVDCDCGHSIGVSASQAGSTVRCPCGTEVDVPNLGRLRESVGQDRYESGTRDTIIRMVKTGELPGAGPCVVSRKPTEAIVELDILLPRFFKTDQGVSKVALLFLGLFAAILLAIVRRPRWSAEGSTTIRVPIHVAPKYQHKFARMGQPRLKRLLNTVPIYARLLEENPHAQITVVGHSADYLR